MKHRDGLYLPLLCRGNIFKRYLSAILLDIRAYLWYHISNNLTTADEYPKRYQNARRLWACTPQNR